MRTWANHVLAATWPAYPTAIIAGFFGLHAKALVDLTAGATRQAAVAKLRPVKLYRGYCRVHVCTGVAKLQIFNDPLQLPLRSSTTPGGEHL